jgi:toxin ParE1/3/4
VAKRRKLRLSKTAQADIEKIDFYSFEKWGEATAQAYMSEIEARLSSLCDTPLIGVDRSDLRPGYRATLSGRHLIYYRADDEFIQVLTILHHSQDQEAFLREAEED